MLEQWLDDALGTYLLPTRAAEQSWAESGCAALSGMADGEPDMSAAAAAGFADRVALALTGRHVPVRFGGKPLSCTVDGASLLAERARYTAAVRNGRTSCNDVTRLLRTADGWISFTISRPDDVDLLPACFEWDGPITNDPWGMVEQAAASLPSVHIRDRAVLLGLSCAIPDEHRSMPLTAADLTVFPPCERFGAVRVVDLSALWAGPLCGHLLAGAGAQVTTVEDPVRPDGARIGAPHFYRALHHGHRFEAVSLRTQAGRSRLLELVTSADVVITSARPRALEQLGIDPHELMAQSPITAWISITGFGPAQPQRIGFGDDAAVAGGLYGHSADEPVFAADALADPLTGLTGAAIAMHALRTATRVHAELSLAGVAARACGTGARAQPLLSSHGEPAPS